jgi:hypothetical protein
MAGKSVARVTRKSWLLSGVAATACLIALPAFGQNIDTTPSAWEIGQFGPTASFVNNPLILSTFGQTSTPTAGQTQLTGFTFYVAQSSGTTPAQAQAQAQAFVYQWAYPMEGSASAVPSALIIA